MIHMFYNMYHIKPQMAEQQILLCLDMLEKRLNIKPRVDDGETDVATRIFDISFKVNDDPLEHNVVENLLYSNMDCISTHQQCIYHMLPNIEPDGEFDIYKKALFGENDEFLIDDECMFTQDLYNKVYDGMAREHVAHWRAGYFEPEDLSEEELVRHKEYMTYARAYPV
jgi:hypothetical protein